MGILTWIIFGLIAGAIAKAIHPGKDPGGWIVTIIIGILGAMLGGWLGTMLLNIDVTSFWSPMSWLLSIGGAVILLFLYSMVTKK
ncbi:GlsB/YeaQ/YmgE family stress response membrane protein [Epilithonimonas hispanica]|uniref:GlsB/YeaQ/YmgE family stress response membrane protein n=1 Tax=Epilithonimonas hispanica TaxID=358687 RepID=A0A3D9CX42_9FLAO|nr:GlsB/YeaQ/YmgE family stress response membrane protein [Epilithonimonas hispanica]REC70333.1 GlsB/YeaQ/YmgE family stress response membrane protein [Epilithonimonas hispanica]